MENEFIKERDSIIAEIGTLSNEELCRAGISLEEYMNPDANTIEKLLEYANNEFSQISIYNDEK